MLEKKLLTLCCAIGILAFGACFLPPIPVHHPSTPTPLPPPPPTLATDLHGVQVIHVVVQNASTTRAVDPARLAQWVTDCINDKTRYTGIHAYTGDGETTGAALLKIEIAKEDAAQKRVDSGSSVGLWLVRLELAATLTGADGTVLRQMSDVGFKRYFSLPEKDPDVWQARGVQQWIAVGVSGTLVNDVLYGR